MLKLSQCFNAHCSHHLQGQCREVGNGLIYGSCSESNGGCVKHGAIKQKETMWLRRWVRRKEVKPDFAQFVFRAEVGSIRLF
jgi:hypothetical protein